MTNTKEQQNDFLTSYRKCCEGLQAISVSVIGQCETCQKEWGATPAELSEACDEGHFSKSPCETCGATLAGMRYSAHALHDSELIHLSACEDCALYIANGQLPDNWEG